MGFEPERSRGTGRINTEFTPPCRLITVTMKLPMMSPAQRDRERVADFPAQCTILGKPQMVGIARLTTADEARLLGDKPDMLAIANPPRLGDVPRPICPLARTTSRILLFA
jgi:hypothetical protein